MHILSVFFFGVTTIGAHQTVASVTVAVTFCAINKSSSDFSFSQYAMGIDRGVLIQNGRASGFKYMWNFSPFIVLI